MNTVIRPDGVYQMSNNKNKKKPEPVKPKSETISKVIVVVIGAVLIATVLYFGGLSAMS